MAEDVRYAVGDLAELGVVSRRTVRYYVQEGLIPPPFGVGRGNHYGREHLDRLLRVKAMQEAGQTLESKAAFPCALPEAGTYQIVATVAVGANGEIATSANETRHAGSARIVVDDALAAVGTDRMPVARVPGPEAHAFPSRTNAEVIEPGDTTG